MGAALFFSRLGWEVTLVEKSARLGALVRGFRRRDLTFETGFHYAGGLAEGGVLHRYLQRLGLFGQGLRIRPLPEPGGEFLRFTESGLDFALPRGLDEFRRLLPGSPEVDDFFRRSLDICRRSPYLSGGGDFDPLALYNDGESLAEALNRLPLSRPLKSLMGFRCLLFGARPSEAAFSQFSLVNGPYLEGCHSFEGGGEALVEVFEAALLAEKITVLTGREVVGLKTDSHNTAVAVECRDAEGRREEIAFEACVYSGSPAALPHLLPEGALRPVLARRLAGFKYTPAPFMVFGRTRSNWLENRQFFTCPDDLENWFDPARQTIYASGGPGRDGFRPVTVVSLLPEGATLAWHRPGGRNVPAYREFKEGLAAEIRARLLKHCPELNGDFEIIASATDLSLGDYSLAFGPGIYGKLHSVSQAPVLPLTRVGRLALAGQNIVMPGLMGVLVSSALAVGSLVGHQAVLEVLK